VRREQRLTEGRSRRAWVEFEVAGTVISDHAGLVSTCRFGDAADSLPPCSCTPI
jgi:hypothetical protein